MKLLDHVVYARIFHRLLCVILSITSSFLFAGIYPTRAYAASAPSLIINGHDMLSGGGSYISLSRFTQHVVLEYSGDVTITASGGEHALYVHGDLSISGSGGTLSIVSEGGSPMRVHGRISITGDARVRAAKSGSGGPREVVLAQNGLTVAGDSHFTALTPAPNTIGINVPNGNILFDTSGSINVTATATRQTHGSAIVAGSVAQNISRIITITRGTVSIANTSASNTSSRIYFLWGNVQQHGGSILTWLEDVHSDNNTGSNGDGDTGSNGDGDTGSNGDGDTGSNGDGDTGSNGDGDTGSNGSGDSGSNGSGDSGSNGSGDSGSNGSGDSGSNGSGNRRPSPPPTASSASVLSGQSDETTGIFAFSPHISSAELPMRTLRELSSLGQDIALTLGDMTITIPARALSDNAPVYAQSAAVSISSVPYRSVAPLNSAYRSGSLSSSNISLLFEMDLSVDAQQIAHLESPVEVRITYENLTSDQLSVFVISDTGRLNQIGGVLRESSGEISFTADELGTFAVIRNSQLSTMSLAVGGYSYSVDGSLRTTDAAPIILNDRSLVPLRIIAEATGSRVDWSHEDRAVTISRYNRELRLFVDMLTPGLDTPAVIVNDRTMVPLRFIAESFGSSVVWDDAAQTITIYHLSDIQSPD